MKEEKEYLRDLAEIRSMMERSSKFLSLSGWAGIMAGVYALTGAYVAYSFLNFHPDKLIYGKFNTLFYDMSGVVVLAIVVLTLAIVTAVFFSYRNAQKRGEKVWNSTSRRLLANMAVPLVVGGIFILILMSKGLIGLLAPATLVFYGLALYNASKFTYEEVKFLGIIQILLGLISAYYIEYALLLWAIGFGLIHIGYGIYMHFRYER